MTYWTTWEFVRIFEKKDEQNPVMKTRDWKGTGIRFQWEIPSKQIKFVRKYITSWRLGEFKIHLN